MEQMSCVGKNVPLSMCVQHMLTSASDLFVVSETLVMIISQSLTLLASSVMGDIQGLLLFVQDFLLTLVEDI